MLSDPNGCFFELNCYRLVCFVKSEKLCHEIWCEIPLTVSCKSWEKCTNWNRSARIFIDTNSLKKISTLQGFKFVARPLNGPLHFMRFVLPFMNFINGVEGKLCFGLAFYFLENIIYYTSTYLYYNLS